MGRLLFGHGLLENLNVEAQVLLEQKLLDELLIVLQRLSVQPDSAFHLSVPGKLPFLKC